MVPVQHYHRRRGAAVLAVVAILALVSPPGDLVVPAQATAPPASISAAQRTAAEDELLRVATTPGMLDSGISGGPGAILVPGEFGRAALRRAGLPADQQRRFDDALVSLDESIARAYLLKALAVGHPVDQLVEFAGQLQGRTQEWLRGHLTLVDQVVPGQVVYQGRALTQEDQTTCGSTAIVVARAIVDPMYAFMLTTGGDPDGPGSSGPAFAARVADEERRVHRATNALWPRFAGTPPWGVVTALNERTAAAGLVYRSRMLLTEVTAGARARMVSVALAALDAGYPVPLLTGDLLPRHYVLLVGRDDDGVLIYQPADGQVLWVSVEEFRHGDLSAVFGYPNVKGVFTPQLEAR
jgi:hypothetical protein